MDDRQHLVRGVVIGVLVMMVIRSLVWLIHPDEAATAGQYALNIGNVAICGLAAWATWRPSEGAKRVLQRVSRGKR